MAKITKAQEIADALKIKDVTERLNKIKIIIKKYENAKKKGIPP